MKILIVTRGYFPAKTYGGPPVSIQNITYYLSKYFQFFVLCSDHELYDNRRLDSISEGWNKHANSDVMYLNDKSFSIGKISQLMKEISPDIVYLNSLFDYKRTLPCLIASNYLHIPVILAPRGELCVNAFDQKYKKIPYVYLFRALMDKKNIRFQSTSVEETQEIMRWMGLKRDSILELSNLGSCYPIYRTNTNKISGECRFVFISRIQKKKNLLFALQLLKDVKKKVTYDIYGPIEDISYWNSCKAVISELPSNVVVTYKGILEHYEVPEIFAKYHGFLFTTFSENYGHVIAEALSQECIVITSDQVPWTDLESENAGWAISLNDRDKYLLAINTIADLNEEEYKSKILCCRKYAEKKLNMNHLVARYIESFNEIVNNNL